MSRERIMLTQAIPAVQQLRRVQGFDPLRFLKRNANGGIELEPRYQRLWFRLACPDGKMLLNRLRITDQIAVYEAQVFLSREDNQPIANFTAAVEKAQAPAGRYVQAAQDAALKTALEGGLERRPDNVAIYVTSNRRHMIRESFSDRQGDDVHARETLEERTSLSERFGLRLSYLALDKKRYQDMVLSLCHRMNLTIPDSQILVEANRWEIQHGSRTPRVAVQLVEKLAGETADC